MNKFEKFEYLRELFSKSKGLASFTFDKDLNLIDDYMDSNMGIHIGDSVEGNKSNHINGVTNNDLKDQYIKEIVRYLEIMGKDSKQYEFPLLFYEKEGRSYGFISSFNQIPQYHVLGPVMIKPSHLKVQEDKTKEDKIPIMSVEQFSDFIQLLDFALNKKKRKASLYELDNYDSASFEKSKEYLKKLASMIKDGDWGYRQLMFEVISNRESIMDLGTVTVSSARHLAVLSVDYACQAAREAGLSSKTVETLYQEYVPKMYETQETLEITSLVNTLIYHLVRLVRLLRGEKPFSLPIQRCYTFIEENINSKLTLEAIAKEVGYSADHLSKIFKSETGVSLNHYIMELKIDNAKLMLVITDMSIGDIANSLSFCSNSHFTKIFKAIVGKTPAQYRKSYTHLT